MYSATEKIQSMNVYVEVYIKQFQVPNKSTQIKTRNYNL